MTPDAGSRKKKVFLSIIPANGKEDMSADNAKRFSFAFERGYLLYDLYKQKGRTFSYLDSILFSSSYE